MKKLLFVLLTATCAEGRLRVQMNDQFVVGEKVVFEAKVTGNVREIVVFRHYGGVEDGARLKNPGKYDVWWEVVDVKGSRATVRNILHIWPEVIPERDLQIVRTEKGAKLVWNAKKELRYAIFLRREVNAVLVRSVGGVQDVEGVAEFELPEPGLYSILIIRR
jgi:hypothetical protein